MKERIVSFDALRFILAMCVVFGHTFLVLFRTHAEETLDIQNLAVDGFFILSGFLLALSYNKSQENTPDAATLFIRSTWHRIKRLYPEYLFALLLANLLYIKHFSASDFFLNSLFIGQINKVPSAINGAWYVSVLFWVGCIYSALLFYKKKTAVYVFIPLLVFFSFSYMYATYSSLSLNANPLIDNIFSAGFLKGFVGMGIGILLFFLCQKMQTLTCSLRYRQLSFLALEIVALVALIYCLSLDIRIKDQYLIYFAYPVILALLYFRKEVLLKFLSCEIWSQLTPSAYMLYLTHHIVIQFTKDYLPYKSFPQISIYILIMVVCVIFGLICQSVCQKSFIGLKKLLFLADEEKSPVKGIKKKELLC